MSNQQSANEIRRVARILDEATERQDVETVLSCFADEGEVEFFGLTFKGKDEIRRAIRWMYDSLGSTRFEPVNILVDGNVFFEEFVLHATPEGRALAIKAAEVLVYHDLKIASLRLYFDRMELARTLATGFIERLLVDRLEGITLRGLV
ncbi:MAG: nuclear transport factor 2 family protein [Anaerolineae bacterium]|jgi:ketosteroid isomerase-like protein